jgi:hypothetical protein
MRWLYCTTVVVRNHLQVSFKLFKIRKEILYVEKLLSLLKKNIEKRHKRLYVGKDLL